MWPGRVSRHDKHGAMIVRLYASAEYLAALSGSGRGLMAMIRLRRPFRVVREFVSHAPGVLWLKARRLRILGRSGIDSAMSGIGTELPIRMSGYRSPSGGKADPQQNLI